MRQSDIRKTWLRLVATWRLLEPERKVLVIGLAVLALVALFPPWYLRDYGYNMVRYHPVWSPPAYHGTHYRVDTTRATLSLLSVAAATGALALLVKRSRPGQR